jgi:hypothetical protein
MARPAESCPECRALVAADQMTSHTAWHTGLSTAVALVTTRTATNHPHGPVTATAERSGKQ